MKGRWSAYACRSLASHLQGTPTLAGEAFEVFRGLSAHLKWSNQYHRMWAPKCYGYVLVKTGYFYGIIHSINVVLLVLLTGISGHNCNMLANLFKTIIRWYIKLSINQLMIIYCGKPSTIWLVVSTILKNMKVSWEGLSHILWKSKIDVWNHQPDSYYHIPTYDYLLW